MCNHVVVVDVQWWTADLETIYWPLAMRWRISYTLTIILSRCYQNLGESCCSDSETMCFPLPIHFSYEDIYPPSGKNTSSTAQPAPWVLLLKAAATRGTPCWCFANITSCSSQNISIIWPRKGSTTQEENSGIGSCDGSLNGLMVLAVKLEANLKMLAHPLR